MKNLFFLFSMTLLFSYCCDKSDPVLEVEPEPVSSVPDCCASSPILAQVGAGKVYVPNVFTPNNDGVNDILGVYTNNEIVNIISFEILTEEGEQVHLRTDATPSGYSIIWDGKANGTVEKGLYIMKVIVESSDGVIEVLEGKVCSFYCEPNQEPEPAFDAILNCGFGLQHDGNGGFDENLSGGEEDNWCFE